MLFWLKKALTVPFLPMYFALIAGTSGCLLLWKKQTVRVGRILVTAGVAAMAIFSNEAVSNALIGSLESRFAAQPELRSEANLPPELRACRAIAVLGGGHADAPSLARVDQLSSASLSRITEALRLLRWMPTETKLITSGHHTPEISHARVLAEAAISLGVPAERIERMDDTWDTDDEIAELKQRLGDAPVAIVTSAWHMPRAMDLSQGYGLHAVPCPTDFMLKAEPGRRFVWARWDLESLERSTKAIHEDLGLLWLKIKR